MRKLGVGLTVIGLTIPSFLQAVGLGEISVNSFLNQPLVAEIQMVSTSPSELEALQVNIAPEQIFQQIGIQRTSIHRQLDFQPSIKNGIPVITVTSPTPITEPFLNFVIEVAWPKGKLLREYTVLLDPPVYRQQQSQAVTTPATVDPAPAVEAPAPAAEVPAPEPAEVAPEPEAAEIIPPSEPVLSEVSPPVEPMVTEVAPPPPASDPMENIPLAKTYPISEPVEADMPAPAELDVAEEEFTESVTVGDAVSYAGTEYEVQRGDTLWQIADNYRPGEITVNQMMIAMLRENPKAFIRGNINQLKRGYVIRVPEAEVADTISNREALAEIKKQRALWEEYKAKLAKTAIPQQAAIDTAEAETPAATDTEAAAVDTEAAPETESVAEAEQAESTETAETAEATPEDSELKILVPDAEGEASATAQESIVVADAADTKKLEQDVLLAQEQIESQARQNEELRSRVGELEALLNDKDRMIELKDEQLLDIQQKLSDVSEAAQGAAAAQADAATEAVTEPESTEATTAPAETEEAVEPVEPTMQEPVPVEEQSELPAAEEQSESPAVEDETVVAESDELMPRIPLDTAEEAVTEEVATELAEEPAEPIVDETVAEAEQADAVAETMEAPAAESAVTASVDETQESPGFFKDLLRNPSLLMGTGFGALLLAGLVWLVARRKSHTELEVPNITRAPTPEVVHDVDEFVHDQLSDTEDDMKAMLDMPETNVDAAKEDSAVEAEAFGSSDDTSLDDEKLKEEFDFIDTAFNISTDDVTDDVVEATADVDEAVEEAVDDALEVSIDEGVEITAEAVEETLDEAPAAEEQEVEKTADEAEGIAFDVDENELPENEEFATDLTNILNDDAESDEVLAEADVYLAYGLNEQAIELLKPALLDQPDRHDYRGKLLEALYAMEDKDGFQEEATTLKNALGSQVADSTVWGRVIAMGKDLMPDSDVFSTEAVADMPLEEITPKKPESIDIDLGAEDFMSSELTDDELKETVIRGEGTAQFDVSDDLAYQDTQAIDPEDMALALEDFDIPDADPDSAETVMMDGATLHGLELTSLDNPDETSGDATNEFQFDASDLDELENDVSFDDEVEELNLKSEKSAPESDAEEFVVDPDTTQLDMKGETEDKLSTSMEMTQVIDADADPTSEASMTEVDLTKDTLALNILDEGEGEVSLLTGEDEIDTKLDLAKAYIDMGDAEGAKDALDEVISAGSDEQRTEAEKLLQQLG